MRAVCYARVSSAAQRERDTIASQLRTLPEFVERMAWTLVRPVGTYVDDGRSAAAGKLEARSGLAAMLRDAAAGVFDVVVVVELDRLTRAEDLAERGAILGALQRAGVRVAAAASGQVLDLSTSSGDLLSGLQAFFAAEWGRKHRERIIQGKLTALQRGRKPSGPTPYGHAYDRATGAWSIDPAKGPVVVEIFIRIAAGETLRAIADDFRDRGLARPRGEWSNSRVYDIVRARTAVGEWTADKARRIVIAVPPIVTEAQWQAAQEALLRHRRRGLRRTRHTYLLEAIARCGACGARMLIRSACGAIGKKNQPAYICGARKTRQACAAAIVKVPDADARAWAALAEGLQRPELLEHFARARVARAADAKDWQVDADGYRKHLARLDRKQAAAMALSRRELLSEEALELELTALRREREAVRAQLQHAETASRQAGAAQARLPDLVAVIDALRERVRVATGGERRELVELLVEPGSVIFRETEIELTLFLSPTAAEGSRGAPAGVALGLAAGCSSVHESELRIRLVG